MRFVIHLDTFLTTNGNNFIYNLLVEYVSIALYVNKNSTIKHYLYLVILLLIHTKILNKMCSSIYCITR